MVLMDGILESQLVLAEPESYFTFNTSGNVVLYEGTGCTLGLTLMRWKRRVYTGYIE